MLKKEMETLVTAYFEDCEGQLAIDDQTGLPIQTKGGGYVYQKLPKTPTLTGLALALGMLSKGDLFKASRNSGKDTREMLKKAISRVEENAERRLIESGVGGAKFFLASNFEGWGSEDEDAKAQASIDLLSKLTTKELKKLIE